MVVFRNRDGKEVNKVLLLPVLNIDSNPNQPRKYFDANHLEELADSIKENGLLQPITVRRTQEGRFQLIAGERRTRAFRMLGYELIPAIIEEYSDEQSATMSLIENLQRKDLNYFEEAAGIAKLMCELSLTQQQVSEKIGKAQPTIANKLRLLRYSAAVQKAFLDNNLSERHARAMLRLQSEEQQLLAISFVSEHRLTAEQAEAYIESIISKKQPERQKTRIYIVKDMRIFLNSINRAISTMRQAGISVVTDTSEDDHYLEYLIRVPKSAVYRQSSPKTPTSSSQP